MSRILGTIPWDLHRTVLPTIPVLTVDELKGHLRAGDDEDADLERYALAAEQSVEEELGISCLTQTWVLRLSYFPCWEILLPRPPLQSVTQVQYIDSTGTTVVLPTTEYTVALPPTNSQWGAVPGSIHLAYGKSWPVTLDVPNAVLVTYKAGKDTTTDVPEPVRTAIKMAAADMYEHREPTLTGTIVNDLPIYGRLVSNYRCVQEFVYR